MGKSNVGWAGEIEAATATGNSFTTKKLSPKRLTAYVDMSRQLIYKDTIGVESAIRRDIVNALNDKLEATILGLADKTDNQPAGIFYGKTIATCDTFAKICNLEATVENANVTGQMKYLLSPAAKAELRAMAKSTKSTQLVFEGGEVDGVPAVVTSNVAGKNFVYGDFSNIAVGSWGDIDITIDEYTQAVNGCVRLVINAFFDEVILRP
jgi:HK97 family phage major capsid protein